MTCQCNYCYSGYSHLCETTTASMDCDDLKTISDAMQEALDKVQPSWQIKSISIGDYSNSHRKEIHLAIEPKLG